LHAHEVQPWTELPLWDADASGLNRTNISRAVRAGLIFSPIEKTVVDTFAWAQAEIRARGSESLGAAGLRTEKETSVLGAWVQRSR
jgi:2'-hydroxyisoflavone reductase